MPRGFSHEIRQYAARTGLAVWAWNSLHANLFTLFWFIASRGQPLYHTTAHRIWHTIQNDTTQREMLLNVANANLAFNKTMLQRVRWIIKTTNSLSTYRNIAAHTPAAFSPYLQDRPAADPFAARDQARKRFLEIKHDQFWRVLVGDLNALSAYTAGVAVEISQPGFGGTLPHRPRMQSLAQIARIEGQISRLAQSEARSHQQFASQLKRRPHSPSRS